MLTTGPSLQPLVSVSVTAAEQTLKQNSVPNEQWKRNEHQESSQETLSGLHCVYVISLNPPNTL